VGRGGLPRCGYFLSGAARVPGEVQYPRPAGSPFVQGVPAGNPEPFVPPGDEIEYLQSQADLLKRQLEQIEARISEIGREKSGVKWIKG